MSIGLLLQYNVEYESNDMVKRQYNPLQEIEVMPIKLAERAWQLLPRGVEMGEHVLIHVYVLCSPRYIK